MVELIGISRARSPCAPFIAPVSERSFTGVEVPCAFTYATSARHPGARQRQLDARARRPLGIGRGHVVGVGVGAYPPAGLDARAALAGGLHLLEHDHARAFAEHEAVAARSNGREMPDFDSASIFEKPAIVSGVSVDSVPPATALSASP